MDKERRIFVEPDKMTSTTRRDAVERIARFGMDRKYQKISIRCPPGEFFPNDSRPLGLMKSQAQISLSSKIKSRLTD